MKKFLPFLLIVIFLLQACSPAQAAYTSPTPPPLPSSTPNLPAATPSPSPALWVSPAVPLALSAALPPLPPAPSSQTATLSLLPDPAGQTEWVYALVAAFPTVRDSVSWAELGAAWAGGEQILFADEHTAAAMKTLFNGDPGPGLRILPPEMVADALWQNRSAWAIVPFEQILPNQKVLEVSGQSPLRKDFDASAYPLRVRFALQGESQPLPVTNRDPQKLVTVVMTGVTALVRATAVKMEANGNTYPARDIRNWLLDADIAHISNEIPFAEGCPPPKTNQTRLIFCSDPKYVELLEYVGADVIELTGNHFQDWGKEATLNTLEMYNTRNLPYYGGGANLADAQSPALLEKNGMKFAFVGCNPAGPTFAWARTDDWPGAAPCGKDWVAQTDGEGSGYEWMTEEIARLKAQGYIVIATFQYFEYYSSDPRPWQVTDFRQMADAGATIVSGSQAHYAQAMEFYNDSFIHYGLGNLFFDQMGYDNPSSGIRTTNTRREFLDRHVFYDGKYLGAELLTAMLEDFSKPRPMTPEERAAFLQEYFEASGWGE